MNKHAAYIKWAKAEKVAPQNVRQIFPTKRELLEFWNDTKGLAWPEFYGESPWDTASFIASMAAGCEVTNTFVLNGEEYKAAMTYLND